MSRNAEQKQKDRKTCFDLLPIAREIKPANRFAKEVVGLAANHWTGITTGAEKFPEQRAILLEDNFRKHFRTFEFKIAHLDLPPREFIELFKAEPIYKTLLAAFEKEPRPPAPELDRPSDLLRFFGVFQALYICRDTEDRRKLAVALDGFRISEIPGSRTTARIEQLTNAFSTLPSMGQLRLRKDTVEISINFGNETDPDAIYMARTSDGQVNTILAINVDVEDRHRLVVARPALFVRIDDADVPQISQIYSANHRLYKVVRKIFERFVIFDKQRFEIVPEKHLDSDSEDEIREELDALQRSSNETDCAADDQ